MSRTTKPNRAPIARQARLLTHQFTAKLTGRDRGPDRQVRRNSVDVDHPDAKPWAKIGDGSFAQGLAHREALIEAADDLRHQQWRELALPEIRAARETRAALAGELPALMESGVAPIGRPATLRMEIARLDDLLERADGRLRRIDVDVLRALLHHLDFATGKLFPSIDTITAKAGCHRNSVVAALRRLKAHGFIAWVRRSMKTGNDGEFAPQRKQASNAYHFDWRRRMAARTWQRFCQRLTVKLRRLGGRSGIAAPEPSAPAPAVLTPLQAALASLGSSVASAST